MTGVHVGAWTARARTADLHLVDPMEFTQLVLVDNYSTPSMCSITGNVHALRPGLAPGLGVVVYDDAGRQRFSGIVVGVTRNSDDTAVITYAGDLVWLWSRIIYPDPTHVWPAQTAVAYDVQIGPAEDRLLAYISRNAGPFAGAVGRAVPNLRLPSSGGRGPSNTTTARFDTLGLVVATLAEQGDMRVRLVQTYAAGDSRHLDVLVEDAPDLSAWARYGTPEASGPGQLAAGWTYGYTSALTTHVLVAAGGELTARITQEAVNTDAEALWGRIETFLDQRQTTVFAEVAQAGLDALAAGAAPTSIAANISESDGLRIGVDIPLGSKVACVIDGDVIVDRVRSVTVTVGGADLVTTEPVFGSADAGIEPTTKQIIKMLKRISVLERTL